MLRETPTFVGLISFQHKPPFTVMPTIALLIMLIAEALAAVWPDKQFEIKPFIRKTDGKIFKWEITYTFSHTNPKTGETKPARQWWMTIRPASTDGMCKFMDRSAFWAALTKAIANAKATRGIDPGENWDIWTPAPEPTTTQTETPAAPPASKKPKAEAPAEPPTPLEEQPATPEALTPSE